MSHTLADLDAVRTRILSEIDAAAELSALDDIRVAGLGKKGEVSLMMRGLGKMSPDEKKVMGPALNGLKNDLNAAVEARKAALENAALDAALASETMDMSLPVGKAAGTLHPVSQVMEEMAVIFSDMGFSVAEGPDIEDDFHNFTALNFPPGHPARDMHFFETDVDVQFRPHHFPFTEPSAEMDVRYARDGAAIKIGSGEKWMEILGCGMVHPNVLRSCGLDPDEYQGFAFGMGVDRLAMLKYGMPDLRDMFASDPRWLAHYGFNPLVQANLATGLS